MKLIMLSLFLLAFWITPAMAQIQTGNTAVSLLPLEQKLALFRDINGSVPTQLPRNADSFLRYKSGVFNYSFYTSDYEVLVDGIPTKNPDFTNQMNRRYLSHAKETFGWPHYGGDWRVRHSEDKTDADLLVTTLNLYFNQKKTAVEWGIDGMTEAGKEAYLNSPELWPSFDSILQKLHKEGPLQADILPYHITVWIVGHEFDKYGNLVLVFKNHFGDDWGQNGFGKMLAMDFVNFRSVKKDLLAQDFGAGVSVLCSNVDNDAFCSWGIGSRPEGCACAEVAPDCHDRNSSVLAEDAKLSCMPNSGPNFPNSDLVVVDVTLNTVSEEVIVTYKNQGTQNITSQFMVMLNAWPEPYWGGNGSGYSVWGINAGETKTMTFSFSQLNMVQSTNYKFTVNVDENAQIDEADETNNMFEKILPLVIPSPDLVVTDIVLDAAGDFVVSYKNQGAKDAASTTTYLRLTQTSTGNYNQLMVNVPSVGQTLTQVFSKSYFTLQGGQSYAMEGNVDFYNHMVESNDSNNTLTKNISIPVPGPDFRVDDIFVSGPQLKVTVRNYGANAPVSYFYVNILANGYNKTYYQGLPQANQSITYSLALSDFGLSSVSGNYNVTATADSYASIVESNESNNSLTKTVTVTAPAMPDHVVDSISFDGTNITATIKNMGTVASGYSYAMMQVNGVYRSAYVPALAAGGSSTFTMPKSNFSLTDGMTYTVNVWADYYGYVTESNELNNASSKSISIPIPASYVDLTVLSMCVSGSNLVVPVKNQGTVYSGQTHYLRVTANGITRYYSMIVGSAGAVTNKTIPFTDFSLVAGNSYTFQVAADSDFMVTENDENNNYLGQVVALPSISYDLIVSDIIFESGSIKVKIKNQGTGTTSSYHDIIVSGNGYSRGYYQQVPAAGMESMITIPPTDFGFYPGTTAQLSAYADYYNAITETNESNNQLFKSVTQPAGVQGIDLKIMDITRYTYSSSYIYAVVRYKNQGTSTGGSFKIQLEGNGRTITSSSYSVPAAGAEGYAYIIVGTISGLWMQNGYYYYLTGNIDVLNTVIESDETNNGFSKMSF